MSKLSRDLRTGLGWGIWYAVACSGMALTTVALRGGAALETYNLSLLGIIAFYVGGGLSAGAVAGLFLRMARGRLGAALVGFLAAIPASVAAVMALTPPDHWATRGPIYVLVGALVLGPLFGVMMWSMDRHGL